jgi:hypothetical protein
MVHLFEHRFGPSKITHVLEIDTIIQDNAVSVVHLIKPIEKSQIC